MKAYYARDESKKAVLCGDGDSVRLLTTRISGGRYKFYAKMLSDGCIEIEPSIGTFIATRARRGGLIVVKKGGRLLIGGENTVDITPVVKEFGRYYMQRKTNKPGSIEVDAKPSLRTMANIYISGNVDGLPDRPVIISSASGAVAVLGREYGRRLGSLPELVLLARGAYVGATLASDGKLLRVEANTPVVLPVEPDTVIDVVVSERMRPADDMLLAIENALQLLAGQGRHDIVMDGDRLYVASIGDAKAVLTDIALGGCPGKTAVVEALVDKHRGYRMDHAEPCTVRIRAEAVPTTHATRRVKIVARNGVIAASDPPENYVELEHVTVATRSDAKELARAIAQCAILANGKVYVDKTCLEHAARRSHFLHLLRS